MKPKSLQFPVDITEAPSVQKLIASLRGARIRSPVAVAVLMVEEMLLQFEKSRYCAGLESCITGLCLEELENRLLSLVDVPQELTVECARDEDAYATLVQFLVEAGILKTDDGKIFTSSIYDVLHPAAPGATKIG